VELQRLVFSFFNAEVASRYWLDQDKPPFKKA